MGGEDQDTADKWKFVILASSFFTHIIISAVNKSFGVLIPDMVVLFNTNVSTIGFICTLPVAFMLMTCPIVAHILKSDLVNPRVIGIVGAVLSSLSLILSGYTRSIHLLATFLVALGCGLSMTYMTQLVALNDFFPKGFIVMNSLTEIGSSLGVVLIPVIIERCKEAYGYNGAMMILGGVMLHLVVTGAAIRNPRLDQREKSHYEDGKGTLSQKQQNNSGSCNYKGDTRTTCISTPNQQRVAEIDSDDDGHLVDSSDTYPLIDKKDRNVATDAGNDLGVVDENESKYCPRKCNPIRWLLDSIFIRHPLFTLIVPAHMLAQYGLYSWRLFLVPHAEWRGIPGSEAVLMSTVGGVGAFTGRILLAIALQLGFDPFLLFSISASVIAATFLVDPWVLSFPIMLVTAFLQGWMLYVNSAMWAALCKLTTSSASFKLACGYAALFGGIGGNAGGFLSGAVFDATQSYTKVFICLGAVHVIIVIDLLVYIAIVRIKGMKEP